MIEAIPFIMFAVVCLVLLLGFPVALSLAGTALFFAVIGIFTDTFDVSFLENTPSRIFGILDNETLIAVPLFIFMGTMLEKSKVAENLLMTMSQLFGPLRGGLAIAVIIVGMLLAASTGIVGATVVTMGLISLPCMLKNGYHPSISTGVICATGTLGQIIPPSIALILLGDVISNSYQETQISMGNFAPKIISVGDLFAGAILPGLVLVVLYILYIVLMGFLKPKLMPIPPRPEEKLSKTKITINAIKTLIAPMTLIIAVLGSILGGYATPTEAAGIGAMGATLIAIVTGQLNITRLQEVMQSTTKVTAMVFLILIGASIFSVVFKGFDGDGQINTIFSHLPGGEWGAILVVMLVIFLLGFILDFIEITFVVIPIIGPALFAMDVDPIWIGIMIAINLQTSFLTPPFGFALFYLRGVAPEEVATASIYRGVIPFILLQIMLIIILAVWPELATWLPSLKSNP